MKTWSYPMIDEVNLSATEHSEGVYISWDSSYTGDMDSFAQDSEGKWYKLSVARS